MITALSVGMALFCWCMVTFIAGIVLRYASKEDAASVVAVVVCWVVISVMVVVIAVRL